MAYNYDNASDTLEFMLQELSGIPVWPVKPQTWQRRSALGLGKIALERVEKVIALLHQWQLTVKELQDAKPTDPQVQQILSTIAETQQRNAQELGEALG